MYGSETVCRGRYILTRKAFGPKKKQVKRGRGDTCIRRLVATCNCTKWYGTDVIREFGAGGCLGHEEERRNA
jgi:hypothetical protein